jgi:hypothetical protein
MTRKALIALAVLAAVALTVVGAAFSRSTSMVTLKGTVGPGYTIKLTKGGKRVKSLKAGKYKFVITDKATIHNFTVEKEHPSTPKIEKHITSTAFTGTKTMVIKLVKGSWSYYCSNHESLMHGDFKVTQ